MFNLKSTEGDRHEKHHHCENIQPSFRIHDGSNGCSSGNVSKNKCYSKAAVYRKN